MTSWQEPTGRERAIEALMDRDKDGDYFRVRKVMEEAVPAALNSRPNKVTKAALVEQAFALHENVIETPAQYDETYGKKAGFTWEPQNSLSGDEKANIWKHQTSLRSAKSAILETMPPPSFFQTIQSMYGSDTLKDMTEYIRNHSIVDLEASSDSQEGARQESAVTSCEGLITNLTKIVDTEEMDEIESGVWIAILSILQLEDEQKNNESSTAESTSADVPPPLFLQVGSLLSVCNVPSNATRLSSSSEDSTFALETELLDYFSRAAAVYEERQQILEARRSEEWNSSQVPEIPTSPSIPSEQSDVWMMTTPSPARNDTDTPPEQQMMDVDQAAESAAALPEADEVEDQDEVEEGWASQAESMSEDEGIILHSEEDAGPDGEPNIDPSSEASSSSSSSGSSSSSENVGENQNNVPEAAAFVESERDISTDDDDDAVLREALGISLARNDQEAEAVRVILADTVVSMAEDALLNPIETPVSDEASRDIAHMVVEDEVDPIEEIEETDGRDDEETSLPQMPAVKVPYPFALGIQEHGTGTSQDPDAVKKELHPALDPSDLSQFASLPSGHVLLHLLSFASSVMEMRAATSFSSGSDKRFRTVPGGMGYDLFSMRKDTRKDSHQTLERSDRSNVLQLLLATLVYVINERSSASESLNEAEVRERIVSPGSAVDISSSDTTARGEPGDEQDDPALNFALNYVEDDASLSIESLENKGMRRKAAAAAHDAEALRKVLKKRTESWKERVAMYSHSLRFILGSIKDFLQSVTRKWLRDNGNSPMINPSVDFYSNCLPASLRVRVLECFEAVFSEGDEVNRDVSNDLSGTALEAWAELFPLLFPSTAEKVRILHGLLQDDSKNGGASEGVTGETVAWSRKLRVMKLHAVARRLRVKDMLDTLVAPPLPFMSDHSVGALKIPLPGNWISLTDADQQADSSRENLIPQISSLVLALAESVPRSDMEVQHLYLALCHRMNVLSLMFDGLYAVTEIETDKTSSITSHKNKEEGGGILLSKVPSGNLVFDSTKCSDSIAILTGFDSPGGNGSTVLQRASKVWGTVLSSHCFSPKSGVHRWAVRLDKCERGHVFIGVATTRANVKTYVGGDKHGWGMIGTQALWHDRRKIRGDYGSSFRTGSTVIVTLDTNLGTLALGLWRDAPVGHQGADSVVQNLVSPKRQNYVGGSIEDWGVAFEGLPLDARVYPAVGLYQRDDRVTLLPVESDSSDKGASVEVLGGTSFYPLTSGQTAGQGLVNQIRTHNSLLNWDGTEYAAQSLARIDSLLDQTNDDSLNLVLPSVLASLCLLPVSIPVLSQRSALTLLPHVDRCLEKLRLRYDGVVRDSAHFAERSVMEGEWTIRATSGEGDLEEYVVEFSSVFEGDICVGFEGRGVGTTGKSKNGLVTIYGSVNCLAVSFVEEWSDDGKKGSSPRDDSSSCVVLGTVSLDGTRLEGRYRNMEFGTTGKVAGMRRVVDAYPRLKQRKSTSKEILKVETLLCLAHGHLAAIISDDSQRDSAILLSPGTSEVQEAARLEKLDSLLGKHVLSRSSLVGAREWVADHMKKLQVLYTVQSGPTILCGIKNTAILDGAISRLLALEHNPKGREPLNLLIEKADQIWRETPNNRGSFAAINTDLYEKTRRGIVSAMLYHASSDADLNQDDSEFFQSVLQNSLKVMEDGIRRAISLKKGKMAESFTKKCMLFESTSNFLLNLDIGQSRASSSDLLHDVSAIYEAVESESDLSIIEKKMQLGTTSSALQWVSMDSTCEVLSRCQSLSIVATESISVGLSKLLAQLSGNLTTISSLEGTRNSEMVGCAGADLGIREQLRLSINKVYESFLNIAQKSFLRRKSSEISFEEEACLDSMSLAFLGVFMLCFDSNAIDCYDSFFPRMSELYGAHRHALSEGNIKGNEQNLVNLVCQLHQRDVLCSVLRCTTAAVHVSLYQLSRDQNSACVKSTDTQKCVQWFRGELKSTFVFLENLFGRWLSEIVKKNAVDEWERWAARKDEKSSREKSKKDSHLRRGSHALWEVGTIRHLDFSSGHRSVPNRHERKVFRGAPAHRHLSHWLHILCALTRSESEAFRSDLRGGASLISILLNSMGLDVQPDRKGVIGSIEVRSRDAGLLPARYRARIALFLRHILHEMDSSEELVEGLLCLAGSDMFASAYDEEEFLASREAASLLRALYLPNPSPWRKCINSVVESLNGRKSFVRSVGLQIFISGFPSQVSRLSFVLLTPAVAIPLYQDSQYGSGGKLSPGSNHTMVPVGADAVLSGLMRSNAEGGIVSNIDEKNGICEVIIMTRRQYSEAISTRDDFTRGKKPALTVRALRTPMSDVIIAQEVPLVVDHSSFPPHAVCSFLEQSLDTLLSAAAPHSIAGKVKEFGDEEQVESVLTQPFVSNNVVDGADQHPALCSYESQELATDLVATPKEENTKNEREDGEKKKSEVETLSSGIFGLALDIMTLRSALVLLSNPQYLAAFLAVQRSRAVLFKVLCLSWPDESEMSKNRDVLMSARHSPLSVLSLHESRFSYMMKMLRNVAFREKVLEKVPREIWETRLAEHKAKMKKSQEVSNSTPPSLPLGRPVEQTSSSENVTETNTTRSGSQSSANTQGDDEEEDQDDASALAAQHLREAAIAQMAELGIPRNYAELALRRIGGTNIEAAVHFCLENGAEIERLLAEEMQRQSGRHGRSRPRDDGHLLQQLMEMGFPRRWCTEALSATGNNVDEALTWILNNNDTLESMDTSEEEEEEDDDDEDDDGSADPDLEEEEESDEEEAEEGEVTASDGHENDEQGGGDEPSSAILVEDDEAPWAAPVSPLRVISGRATIDSSTLEVSGQSSGGFASVGMKGVLLTQGKWYYEVILGTAGCIQLGFGDASFAGHCNADRGDGCGDSSSSFSFDGWRRLRWHATATEWGCRWKEGDVVGCMVDIDERKMSFTLNGQGEAIGMGVAFSSFNFCGGLYPVVSFNRREKLRLILGGSGAKFRHEPPSGFRGVGEALLESVKERDQLVRFEEKFGSTSDLASGQKYLADFSDEEHGNELFSWSHRYYGSDASVHLGAARSKAIPSRSADDDQLQPKEQVSRRVEKAWKTDEIVGASSAEELIKHIRSGYEAVQGEVAFDIFSESLSLLVLLCRKLLLHITVTLPEFDATKIGRLEEGQIEDMVRLWKVLEVSCSARNWSGEAGAMAMAAEALGLGIQLQGRPFDRLGSFSDERALVHRPAVSQLLTCLGTVPYSAGDTSISFVAASEWGGSLSYFLRDGLESAVSLSVTFRNVVIAFIRRSVRVLAGIDEADAKIQSHQDGVSDVTSRAEDWPTATQPDARLLSFVTGVLLNAKLSSELSKALEVDLFQAWSVGMLSASLPWRMISAFTISTILQRNSTIFSRSLTPTLACYFGRLKGTVARRVWAERAAYPVCSRYVQALFELLAAVRKSVQICSNLPDEFLMRWNSVEVEASAPKPLDPLGTENTSSTWVTTEGWCSNEELWTGTLEYGELDWSKPARVTSRPLTDGEGPPMLREGCLVMRGVDWDTNRWGNDDGYDVFEVAKRKRDEEMKVLKEAEKGSDAATVDQVEKPDDPSGSASSVKKRKKRVPHPKLPVGTVLSIEPWNGQPAMARKIRWLLTGVEGIYRFGGDGGRHDIVHVETNQRGTKVVKKHPFPETSEQCAARRGYGCKRSYSALIRFRSRPKPGHLVAGILELPDFGAGIKVSCDSGLDGTVCIKEEELLYGSRDAGWEARFGQPSYIVGSQFVMRPVSRNVGVDVLTPYASCFDELEGSSSFTVPALRNPADGSKMTLSSSLRLRKGRSVELADSSVLTSFPPPLSFDRDFHAPNLAVSRDGRSVTCIAADGRGTAFIENGFSKGCHYWELKIESCESGSIFIGCAEKPPQEGSNRFNRWLGWGFVNFRATYSSGSEKVYGVHANSGDNIGVLLDCDAGRLSFFYDGMKYGEHVLNDLGCAFESLSPFGFSVEGCGTGGEGQGATAGFPRSPSQGCVRPRTLFPVVGLRNHGDRVTICPGWQSTYGVDGVGVVRNVMRFEEEIGSYSRGSGFTDALVKEGFDEYKKWLNGAGYQTTTRGSRRYKVELDTSPFGCAAACAAIGLNYVLLPGDRVGLKRSSGRNLELAEEAVILGQHNLKLYYQIVSQKNEGQSLREGGDLPHFFEECDATNGIEVIAASPAIEINLPLVDRFRWTLSHGLKVVYAGGAVVRSDIEINDSSISIGTIPAGTVIEKRNIIERRVNSCGVVRFLVNYDGIQGYISANIRGGSEEPIVQLEKCEEEDDETESFPTPHDCAKKWTDEFESSIAEKPSWDVGKFSIASLDEYQKTLSKSMVKGMSGMELDSLLAKALGAISDFSVVGDALECSFQDVGSALANTFEGASAETLFAFSHPAPRHDAETILAELALREELPTLQEVMVRLSILRAFNRRAQFALPWMSIRPCQEGSALLGGIKGFGPTIDKAGRNSVFPDYAQLPSASSVASRVRLLRGILFTNVKRDFLHDVTLVTTTPTPLSHDEYELPREIRTVRINRMRAARAMESQDLSIKRKYSIFAQLQNETKNWGGAALRRGYVAKGHGGQKRAFKVKFVGEGVNDYSGPYREVFADALAEVQKIDGNGRGVIGVLDASPNTAAGIGEKQGLHVFSLNSQDMNDLRPSLPEDGLDPRETEIREAFSSLISSRNESSREVEEALVFLGRITGAAYRHGILVDLPLPNSIFWKMLVEESPGSRYSQLSEIDLLAARSNLGTPLLWWQRRMLNFFVEGLSNVIPFEILPLFSADELRDTFCGSHDVDVDLLKRVSEYEGYEETDEVVSNFWSVLRESSSNDRRAFLQYVWARNRLPLRVADFEAPFKIMKDTVNTGERADQALPSASTCFFSLTLPSYSSAEILKKKLLFAIHNVTTMETDFQTNNAEVAEGYRSFSGP